MTTPTKILSDEHKEISKEIEALRKECEKLNTNSEIDKEFFGKKIDFIKNYADHFHHAKEENILFVELCRDDVAMHCNPILQMLREHEMGRNFVKEMEGGLWENNKDKILKNVMKYCALLREHIFKEDNILYPMADKALSPKKQKEILEKFKTIKLKRGG